jgi:hypothetical protein
MGVGVAAGVVAPQRQAPLAPAGPGAQVGQRGPPALVGRLRLGAPPGQRVRRLLGAPRAHLVPHRPQVPLGDLPAPPGLLVAVHHDHQVCVCVCVCVCGHGGGGWVRMADASRERVGLDG